MAGPEYITQSDGTSAIRFVGADPSQTTVTKVECVSGGGTDTNRIYGESFNIDTAGNRYVYHWSKPMEGLSDTGVTECRQGNLIAGNVNIESITCVAPVVETVSSCISDGTNISRNNFYVYPQQTEITFGEGARFNANLMEPITNDTNGMSGATITFGDNNTVYNCDFTEGNYTVGFNDFTSLRPNGRRVLTISEGPEAKARKLLHRMLGESAFRGYIRNGFVSYRGKSGKIYQIFPGYGETQVWDKGEPVERLCLIFKDSNLPPTDSVVMRLLMLEHDEEEFRKLANVHVFKPSRERYTDPVVKGGRILRMVKDKKAGNAAGLFRMSPDDGVISFTTGEHLIIRVA